MFWAIRDKAVFFVPYVMGRKQNLHTHLIWRARTRYWSVLKLHSQRQSVGEKRKENGGFDGMAAPSITGSV